MIALRLVFALALLAAASGAQASPIGTPQSTRPRDGAGQSLTLPFGHHRDAAVAAEASTAGVAVPRRRLSQAEWRRAYIARHGHDLQPAAHPGH